MASPHHASERLPTFLALCESCLEAALPDELLQSLRHEVQEAKQAATAAERRAERVAEEFEEYKRRSKVATAMLQERSVSSSSQLQGLQSQVGEVRRRCVDRAAAAACGRERGGEARSGASARQGGGERAGSGWWG